MAKEIFKTDETVEKKVADAVVEEEKTSENTSVEKMKYSIGPFLTITVFRENRVYKFEMPIGAQLDECVEACNECLSLTIQMREAAQKKEKEAKEKAEKTLVSKEKSPDKEIEKKEK